MSKSGHTGRMAISSHKMLLLDICFFFNHYLPWSRLLPQISGAVVVVCGAAVVVVTIFVVVVCGAIVVIPM